MEKKIYTKKLALELRRRGFSIIRTEPNYKKPQFDVYIFRDTPAFEKAMKEIQEQRYS